MDASEAYYSTLILATAYAHMFLPQHVPFTIMSSINDGYKKYNELYQQICVSSRMCHLLYMTLRKQDDDLKILLSIAGLCDRECVDKLLFDSPTYRKYIRDVSQYFPDVQPILNLIDVGYLNRHSRNYKFTSPARCKCISRQENLSIIHNYGRFGKGGDEVSSPKVMLPTATPPKKIENRFHHVMFMMKSNEWRQRNMTQTQTQTQTQM